MSPKSVNMQETKGYMVEPRLHMQMVSFVTTNKIRCVQGIALKISDSLWVIYFDETNQYLSIEQAAWGPVATS